MNKRIVTGIITLAIAMSTASAFAAENDEPVLGAQSITVNDESVELDKLNLSTYIFEEDDTVMVPLRAVAEKMGYEVGWNGETQEVIVSDDEWQTVINIGEDRYYGVSKVAIGMTAPMSYGSAPTLFEDTTFVPAKMFELMGYDYTSVGQFVNFTNERNDDTIENEPTVQIPNPFTEYKTSAELNENMGFDIMEIGKLPVEVKSVIYIGSTKGLSQVLYEYGKDKEVLFRQSKDSEDNSGDYNIYADIKNVKNGDTEITLKGADGKYNLAVWNEGEYSFSIHIDDAAEESVMLDMINSLYPTTPLLTK